MMEITYFGNATFGIELDETHLLVDPYITENEECPWDIEGVFDEIGVDTVDAVCVTHMADDHLGDALEMATEYGIHVISEPAVIHYLRQNGVSENQLSLLVWGLEADIGDLSVRALEAHHASTVVIDDEFISGLPLGFLISSPDSTVYHMGDTAIFSDLELFGELYKPDVTLLGVGQAYDVDDSERPITRNIHELNTDEAVLAAEWIDSDHVVPMHYLPDERESFLEAINDSKFENEVVPLDPGETLRV